jgi:hypothetical protein
VFTETLPRNGLHNPVVLLLLGADRTEKIFPYTVAYFKVFTRRRIETTILLLLPVFFAVRMFTDIPLLLRNLAKDCSRRVCLRGNLFTNPLPGNALTCHIIHTVKKGDVLKSTACYMLHAYFLLGLSFDLEDGDDIFLRNSR